jgi:hypothetical protein
VLLDLQIWSRNGKGGAREVAVSGGARLGLVGFRLGEQCRALFIALKLYCIQNCT